MYLPNVDRRLAWYNFHAARVRIEDLVSIGFPTLSTVQASVSKRDIYEFRDTHVSFYHLRSPMVRDCILLPIIVRRTSFTKTDIYTI